MRILQLGKFYPVKGGVEKVMYDLMTGLGQRGIDCDMLCAESQGRGAATRIGSHARLITCRTWVKAASTTISPSMTLTLRKIAKDYDIIHVHHPDPMAALALRLSGYKGRVVLHWHSDIVKQKKFLRLYLPLQRWLINRADVIVGTSPEYISHSPWLDGVRQKCRCVPIGIVPMVPDIEGAAAIRRIFPDKKIVFFLGRLIAYKGLEYLVGAAAHLPEDYVVAIGGTGILHDSLQQQIDMQQIGHKVRLLGEIPQEDLAAWYTACDVFCLPSVMKTEAFGIVQIEAMSLGTPVVATRIDGSGTAWVNEHGVSGLNVEPRDPRALAEAIVEITKDAETAARYGAGASARFNALFHIDRMLDGMQSLYDSIIK